MKPNVNSNDVNANKQTAKSIGSKKIVSTTRKLKKSTSKEENSSGGAQSTAPSNDSSSSKDKNNYANSKVYAGFNYKTVKCMWEQHNKHETDVAPEVYTKLAEDLTYKMWEIANSIKTFARHSEGRVTYDLVNEVLKDANVASVVGANDHPWDSIEYDEVFFFNQDEVVDLREEYIKDVKLQQCGPLTLTTTWMAEPKMAGDLTNFCSNLCDSIFLGEEEVFQLAIETCISSPHISALIKLLITKLIEMLSFDYTVQTLDRSLKFLAALTRNSFTRDLDFFVELGYLCQLLVSLLLGPYNALAPPPPSLKNTNQHCMDIKTDMQVDDLLDDNTHFMDEEAVLNEENNSDHLLLNSNTINDILNNIEKELDPELTKMIDQSESEHDFSATQLETEYFDNYSNESTSHQYTNNNEVMMIHESMIKSEEPERKYLPHEEGQQEMPLQNVCSPHISEISSMHDDASNSGAGDDSETTIMYTKMCSIQKMNELCQTIGMCCKWGFVEHECLYWIVKRLELFFKHTTVFNFDDYEWIYRAFSGVWAIGEFAFREFSVYLEKINPHHVSEFYASFFNAAGIYLRGRKDMPIYEWLYELGGDSVFPFMIYYTSYLNKVNIKHDVRHKKQNPDNIYKIVPKLSLKAIDKRPANGQSAQVNIANMFPEYQKYVKHEKSKFSFRFAGCRPVNIKSKKQKPGRPAAAIVEQNQPMLDSFNRKVVVGQKKIMKSLSNRKKRRESMNFSVLAI